MNFSGAFSCWLRDVRPVVLYLYSTIKEDNSWHYERAENLKFPTAQHDTCTCDVGGRLEYQVVTRLCVARYGMYCPVYKKEKLDTSMECVI